MGRHKHSSKYKSHHSTSHKKRHSKERHSRYYRHSRRHRRGQDESDNSSSVSNEYHSSDSESDLDIDKPLLTLTEYLDNKQELIHQVFKTLRGHKLKSMVPDVLCDYSLSEIRNMCHEELKVMSVKNIKRLMDGEQPAPMSISESECNEENIVKNSEKEVDVKEIEYVKQIADSTCDKEMDVSEKETSESRILFPSIVVDTINNKSIFATEDNTGDSKTDSNLTDINSSTQSLNKSEIDSPSMSQSVAGEIPLVDEEASKIPTIKLSSNHDIPSLLDTTEKSGHKDHCQAVQFKIKQGHMKTRHVSPFSGDNKSETGSSPLKEKSPNPPAQVTTESSDDLETLELELRARAIRSLLKSQMKLPN